MSLQPNELLIIAVIALLLLGPNQLPGALRKFGKAMGEVKRVSDGFQREVRNAFEDAEEDAAARNAGLNRPEASEANAATPELTSGVAKHSPPEAQPESSLPDGSTPREAAPEQGEDPVAEGQET